MKTKTRRSREQWQELVWQWKMTSMTAIAWCRKQSIPYQSFIIWKNRFKRETSQPTTLKSFVELVDTAPAYAGIEIHLRSLRLTLCKNFDPETLSQCLQVLERV